MARHYTPEQQASMLLDAVVYGVDATSQKYGVSPNQLTRWSKKVKADTGRPDLALTEETAKKLRLAQTDWEKSAQTALDAIMGLFARYGHNPKSATPQAIRAAAGALKLTVEAMQLVRAIDARTAKPGSVSHLQATASLPARKAV